MTFTVIDPTETEFKAPLDETLMEKVRTNFDDHESRLGMVGGGGGGVSFKVNGVLSDLRPYIGNNEHDSIAYQLDASFVSAAQSFSRCRLFMRKTGDSGKTVVDVKRKQRLNHTITSIDYQMNLATQAISVLGTSLNTQAISLKTPTISTLLINREKSQENISEILSLGSDKFRLNLEGSVLDSDWKVGEKILVASATNGGNNGEFTIDEVNSDGYPSIVITNASGVEEFTSPAVVDLQMFQYVFTNPADSAAFIVGEEAIFSGHTTGANNGTFTIVRVNDAGNNLIVYNSNAGATTQGGAAGTVQTTRFVYSFASAVLTTDFFVGEKMTAASHTNPANDGQFVIRAINEAGNNLVVTNNSGVVQAGAAGTVNTNRYIYSFLTNPASDISVNDQIGAFSHSSSNNDGEFTVLELQRGALNNLIVYNENGVTQGSPAGSVRSEKMIVSFGSDLSSSYIVDRSLVTIKNSSSAFLNKLYFEVVEINRGGGANYNVVIKVPDATTETVSFAQLYARGQIDMESRSLFSTLPEISAGENPDFGGDSAVFVAGSIEADSILSVDLIELATGFEVFDLSVDLS